MTSFTFEDGTQADASQFVAGDTLTFRSASALDVGVAYANGAYTLSYGGKALTFGEAALERGAAAVFPFQGASYHLMELGTDGEDYSNVYVSRERALWTFGGNDEVVIGGPGAIQVHGGAGNDRVTVDNAIGPAGDMITGAYLVDGGDGSDILDLRFATRHVTAWGGSGGDRILGGTDADHLYGNAPGTVAGGADGYDTIDGGLGHDYIQANAGNDLIFGGGGNDRIYGGADNDTMDGEEGWDYLQGNKGDDVIFGYTGRDTLRGGAGDDLLDGGAGNDSILGDAGNDTIAGGGGTDIMSGGAGGDTFRFGGGDATFTTSGEQAHLTDVILDFTHAVDRIAPGYAVQALLVDTLTVYTDVSAAAAYATQLMAGHAGDREMVALAIGSDTWLFFSGGGGNTADSAVTLRGVSPATLTLDDFT